ncbi:hypothetical protein Tco_0471935 [Tanacetum coccineum]
MDNPNLTMEEYMRLEEEKARKRGKVFNWKTATYGKIRLDDDFYDLRSMEAEFLAIVVNKAVKIAIPPGIVFVFERSRSEIRYLGLLIRKSKNETSILVTEISRLVFPAIVYNANLNVFIYLIRRIHSQYIRFKFLYSCAFLVDFADMALPPREQRHRFLRYEGLEYIDSDIADFKSRIAMEHLDEAGVVVFTSQAWRRMFSTRGPLVWELILEFLSMLRFGEFILALGLHTGEEMESPGFARYWSKSERMIPEKGDLHDYWRDISTNGDFLGPPHSYTLIRDPVLRLCHRMMAIGK